MCRTTVAAVILVVSVTTALSAAEKRPGREEAQEGHLPWAVCVTLKAPSGPLHPRPGMTFYDSSFGTAEEATARRHEIILSGVITSRTGDNGDEEDEWPADMIYKATVEHTDDSGGSVCVAGE